MSLTIYQSTDLALGDLDLHEEKQLFIGWLQRIWCNKVSTRDKSFQTFVSGFTSQFENQIWSRRPSKLSATSCEWKQKSFSWEAREPERVINFLCCPDWKTHIVIFFLFILRFCIIFYVFMREKVFFISLLLCFLFFSLRWQTNYFLCFIIITLFNMHPINFQTLLVWGNKLLYLYPNVLCDMPLAFRLSPSSLIWCVWNESKVNKLCRRICFHTKLFCHVPKKTVMFSPLKLDNRFCFFTKYLTQLSNAQNKTIKQSCIRLDA